MNRSGQRRGRAKKRDRENTKEARTKTRPSMMMRVREPSDRPSPVRDRAFVCRGRDARGLEPNAARRGVARRACRSRPRSPRRPVARRRDASIRAPSRESKKSRSAHHEVHVVVGRLDGEGGALARLGAGAAHGGAADGRLGGEHEGVEGDGGHVEGGGCCGKWPPNRRRKRQDETRGARRGAEHPEPLIIRSAFSGMRRP